MSDAAARPLYVYAVLSKELVDPAKSVQAATGERRATAHDYDAPNQPPRAADPAQRPGAWQGGAMSEYVARDVVVHGVVQGVFFRDTCRREAERLGVAGWVRNEPDGTVAGHFEGPAEAVEALVRWCHDGPPRAQVRRVDVHESEPRDADGFTAF